MTGIGRFQHTGAAPQTNLATSMLSTDTSFTTASGNGYPDGSVGDFVIAVDPGLPTEEKILCSSRAGAVFTVAGGVAGRGYDNTSAAGHTAPTALVEHVVAATEIDDASRHINATASVLSDDHTNYPLLTGARAFTGAVSGSSTFTGTAMIANLTGTAGRFVGNTAAGAPSSGTYVTGDIAWDTTYLVPWICSAGGSPGTWKANGTGHLMCSVYRNATWTPSNGGTIPYDTVTYDPLSMFNTSTHTMTTPSGLGTGVWHIYACASGTANAGTTANLFLEVNSSTVAVGPEQNNPNQFLVSGDFQIAASTAVNCQYNLAVGSISSNSGQGGSAFTYFHAHFVAQV